MVLRRLTGDEMKYDVEGSGDYSEHPFYVVFGHVTNEEMFTRVMRSGESARELLIEALSDCGWDSVQKFFGACEQVYVGLEFNDDDYEELLGEGYDADELEDHDGWCYTWRSEPDSDGILTAATVFDGRAFYSSL